MSICNWLTFTFSPYRVSENLREDSGQVEPICQKADESHVTNSETADEEDCLVHAENQDQITIRASEKIFRHVIEWSSRRRAALKIQRGYMTFLLHRNVQKVSLIREKMFKFSKRISPHYTVSRGCHVSTS